LTSVPLLLLRASTAHEASKKRCRRIKHEVRRKERDRLQQEAADLVERLRNDSEPTNVGAR
jgi:hypothetical protein